MSNEHAIKIRKFNKEDREAVRDITYETAFLGESADAFFDGKKIICDALTLYFTDYEPEASFVAEDASGVVVGCLIGTKNKIISEKVMGCKIFPGLIWEALINGILFKGKNIRFIFNILRSILKGEFKMPDFNKKYPAALHINIRKEYRGFHIGSRLIAAYLDYLKKEKIAGVCLATMSKGSGEFFSKQGFELLYTAKRSYFRHLLQTDVPVLIYGKIL